ncbi:MAG: ArsR family transcriptional regulator [Micromonosporaceae bacterium]
MLTYELSSEDLVDIRFAVSPAAEAGLSMRALRNPGRFPLQLPWVRRVQPRLEQLDWDVLDCLLNDRMASPDFLAPHPESPLTRFEDELEAIASTNRETFERQLVAINGQLPPALADRGAVGRVAEALREYWTLLIQPYWPRMRAVLSGDISYRGYVLAQRGTAAMLNDLAPVITYEDGLLRVDRVSDPSRRERVGGRGLTLLPTMFGPYAVIPFDIGAPPLVGYPPRGQGLLWMSAEPATPDDLARLLGAPKAQILTLVAERPRTTRDLSLELGVTPSAVSQHLQVLRRNGLVEPYRVGKLVHYQGTDLTALLVGR